MRTYHQDYNIIKKVRYYNLWTEFNDDSQECKTASQSSKPPLLYSEIDDIYENNSRLIMNVKHSEH